MLHTDLQTSHREATMKKVHAVTGAFGFSGKYIAKSLLDKEHTVVTLTGSPDRPNPFKGRVVPRPYHFEDMDAMTETLRDVEVLYNTYWVRFNHDKFNHADAVQNTLRLFKAAKDAGVERVVHVSITNADESSHLEYFHGKGILERSLRESGLSYAILRPAVLFGPEDILINNIAWALRHFPFFGVFGDGSYHVQPIFVDDLAKLAVEQGECREDCLIQAVGPEDFTYDELVKTISRLLGLKRPILHTAPWFAYMVSWIAGKFLGDVVITREEIEGLASGLLHAPGFEAPASTKLSDWVRDNADSLGKKYANELARRKDRTLPYSA